MANIKGLNQEIQFAKAVLSQVRFESKGEFCVIRRLEEGLPRNEPYRLEFGKGLWGCGPKINGTHLYIAHCFVTFTGSGKKSKALYGFATYTELGKTESTAFVYCPTHGSSWMEPSDARKLDLLENYENRRDFITNALSFLRSAITASRMSVGNDSFESSGPEDPSFPHWKEFKAALDRVRAVPEFS